jgi:RNA polymerase sigma-70 factor (ECF subfamily)
MDFEAAIIPYIPDLSAYCRHLSGSDWDGDDLAQETLVRTYAHWLKQRSVPNAKAFLLRTARNIWIDEHRKYRSRVIVSDPSAFFPHSERAASCIGIRQLLEEAAGKVSLRCLEMILLADLYGYSMEEIARLTRSSVSGVKSALHRARKMVRGGKKSRSAGKIPKQKLEEWSRRIFEEFSA